eukprot:909831-Rhodomonas_salina.3
MKPQNRCKNESCKCRVLVCGVRDAASDSVCLPSLCLALHLAVALNRFLLVAPFVNDDQEPRGG